MNVQAPDGSVIQFPDDTPPDTINRVMQENFGPKKAAAAGPQSREQQGRARMQKWAHDTLGPVGDAGNAVSDFGRQVVNNLGIGDEMSGLASLISGRGYREGAAGSRQDQAGYAAAHPGLDLAATIGGIAAAGKPGVNNAAMASIPAAPMRALRAGATATAVNAPFALARPQGTLQERLPATTQEEALTFGLGAGFQGLANGVSRMAGASRASPRLADFQRAGVQPTAAAVHGGMTGGLTKAISENFFAGGAPRKYLQESLDQTRDASQRLAQGSGAVSSPLLAGEGVRAGVQRFAGAGGTFKTRAEGLFQRATGPLAPSLVQPHETAATLSDILSSVAAPHSADIIIPQRIRTIADALQNDSGRLTFGDLRAWRTWVRTAQGDPVLAQSIDAASLQRLEGALTQDIYQSAASIGGRPALHAVQRADQFYRAGMNRINTALQPFAHPLGRGETAYERVIALAGEKGGARQLASLKRSLAPDEFNQVRATILSRMGKPGAGAPTAMEDGAFSVDNFVKNYAAMSPEGRATLFGSRGGGGAAGSALQDELDNLVRVAGYQKQVETMTNRSRSGQAVSNLTINPITLPHLVAGMSLTGEALTNPRFVRWLASAPTAAGTPGGMAAHLKRLAQLAGRDPALVPIYQQMSGDRSSAAGSQSRVLASPR